MTTHEDLFVAALEDVAEVVANACVVNPNYLPDEVCKVDEEADHDTVKEWAYGELIDGNVLDLQDILCKIDEDAKKEAKAE